MSASIQQRLVDAIAKQLTTIKVTNGYNTDVPDYNIFVWMPLELQTSRMPSLNLRDLSCAWEDSSDGTYFRTQSFDVVGMLAGGEQTHVALRALQSDLIKALYNGGDATWGKLAQDTLIAESEIVVAQADQTAAGVRIAFDVTFYQCKGDDGRYD